METLSTGGTSQLMFFLILGVGVFVFIAILGLILSRLYKKATKDTALVKTGLGGEKVIMTGGTLVIPSLQEIALVNMETLRITVVRRGEDAMISKDNLLVDIEADFFIRVDPKKESVTTAAQTLGDRLGSPERVKEVMESKLVDGLRSSAAGMAMNEMHLNRQTFVQNVQQAVAEDLSQNGLMLESVALTSFNQTPQEYFKPDNAFHATGLALLATITEQKKKETNDTQLKAKVEIEQANLDAETKSLEIQRQSEELKLAQDKAIKEAAAAQAAQIAVKEAEQKKLAETAEIEREQAIKAAQITSQQELERQKVAKDKAVRQAQILSQQEIEVAEADKLIAVAQKSEEESAARAKAAEANIQQVENEEQVKTTQEVAQANRAKQIQVIAAEQDAEQEKVRKVIESEAQLESAKNEAMAIEVQAEAQAKAEELKAQAAKITYETEAQGKLALNSAENTLSAEILEYRRAEIMLNQLPEIIKQSVAPMENIDSIKIMQGFGNAGQGQATEGQTANSGSMGSLVEQLLSYRLQAPVVDKALADLGIVGNGEGLEDLLTKGPSINTGEAKESDTKAASDDTAGTTPNEGADNAVKKK